jgi:hypothetical protein
MRYENRHRGETHNDEKSEDRYLPVSLTMDRNQKGLSTIMEGAIEMLVTQKVHFRRTMRE